MSCPARDPWTRFWPKVDARGDCWEWRAAIRKDGYGAFWDGTAMRPAHRVAYEMLVGPVATDLQVDHLCKNRRCVNPDHLEPVTPALNRIRGEYGKAAQAAERNKTHCAKGHPYAGDNLYVDRAGHRQCRECKRQWQNAKRSKPGAQIRYDRGTKPFFEVTITEGIK